MAIKVMKTSFHASPEDTEKLFACNRIAAMIWNKALSLSREYALGNDGAWIPKAELYGKLKNLYPLHSQSVQMVADKYLDARNAAHAAIKKGFKNKYPWRQKKNFNTQWKDKAFSFDFEKGILSLSLGIWDRRRQKGITVRLPRHAMEKIDAILAADKDAVSQIELLYDNGLMLSITYDDGTEDSQQGFSETAGVDLGEIHAIAACATNGNSVIITGRKLRSIHRLRNKLLASISRAQSKCSRGSRRWKKLQRKKRYILSKSRHQVAYKTHEITKNFVDWCVANNVGKVYCGDPEGAQRNTSGRKKKNRADVKAKKKIRKKKVSQKLSNWNFGKVKEYLRYKLQCQGIAFETISEAYTSQTCPVCGQRHKTSTRTYRCKCGYEAHRDVHGAHNILSLGTSSRFVKVCDFEKRKPKYLRLAA